MAYVAFRREKFIPLGGPNGGDGGDGGDVWLPDRREPQHLVDFRHGPAFRPSAARRHGQPDVYGKAGAKQVILVPVGTVVHNVDTDEVIGDMTAHGQRLLVARGKGSLGNMHFKSSVNPPRRSTPGTPGETRTLRLELKLLADVGLLGFPERGQGLT